MTEQKTFLNPRELVAFLAASDVHVTEDRVRRWLRTGRVPSVLLPGSNRRLVRWEVAEGILRGEYGGESADVPEAVQ